MSKQRKKQKTSGLWAIAGAKVGGLFGRKSASDAAFGRELARGILELGGTGIVRDPREQENRQECAVQSM